MYRGEIGNKKHVVKLALSVLNEIHTKEKHNVVSLFSSTTTSILYSQIHILCISKSDLALWMIKYSNEQM